VNRYSACGCKRPNWYLQIVEKQLCIQINVTEYWRGKQNGNDNAIDNIWYNLNDDFVNANAKECCSVELRTPPLNEM
jgi:hypothetical protein